MENFLPFLTNVLTGASEIARTNFRKTADYSVKTHDHNQVLTETDLAISKYLLEQIKVAYPTYNVIDEEAGVIDNGSAFTWVLDPIDGTSNFAVGVPLYGCMIGLLYNDHPLAGGVALPSFQELYIAQKDQGALCNSEQLQLKNNTKMGDSLLAYGFDSHKDNPELTRLEGKIAAELILHCRNLRSSNSVFDIMQVAHGRYGAFLNQTTKVWDNVAPQIIIEEAGGVYTDFYGKPMDYTDALKRSDDNFTCCVATPAIHAEVQALLATAFS